MQNVKKVYFNNLLTTYINEKGEEKKNLILPKGWNDPNFSNEDKGYGYLVKTGQISGITVLDCDDKEAYLSLCEIYPNINKHYTVKTRRGYHVYFKYNKDVKKFDKVKYGINIDTQNNGALIIGAGTVLTRHNDEKLKYTYMFGDLRPIPDEILEYCQNHSRQELKEFTSNTKYNYEITDEQLHDILKQIEEKHDEYFKNYQDWLIYTTIMKGLNQYDMWDDYNKKYTGYNKATNLKTWESIKIHISINYFCKLLQIPYMKYYKVDKTINNDITTSYKQEINNKYITVSYKDIEKYDTIILESKTGTGKTTGVSKMCEKYLLENNEYSILSIVNLISLADQQCVTFEKSNITLMNYKKDFNPSLMMIENSVICINSLYKLAECDFSHKIVYIDEIHALTKSMSHNATLKFQQLIFNTLLRIIKTCYKLIISDAHILDNTLLLIKERLTDTKMKTKHYVNTYNKFQDVTALKFNDENKFYEKMEHAVIENKNFSFCSDSKNIITNWYNWLYDVASEKTQAKMFLFTSDTDISLCEDWTDKIIFYSPKISCGVDITILTEQTTQYVYITGKSVDSIQLYQMSTRTRNMNEINYYSTCQSKKSIYENIVDCENKLHEEYLKNKFGLSCIDYKSNRNMTDEDVFFHIYADNEYRKDLLTTNIEHFYKVELKNAGFNLICYDDEKIKLSEDIKDKMNEVKEEINKDKFIKLVDNVDKLDDDVDIGGIKSMVDRVKILNINTKELTETYKDIIEDEYKFEQFLNYNRLNKSHEYCKTKLNEVVNNKLLCGIQSNVWNKINYIHALSYACGINNIFDFNNIQMFEKTKANLNLITSIKVLYNKRDKVKADDYNHDNIVKLYIFMIESLIKKLGIIKSVKSNKRDETRNKRICVIDEDNKNRYDELISIMNKNNKDTTVYDFSIFDDENA